MVLLFSIVWVKIKKQFFYSISSSLKVFHVEKKQHQMNERFQWTDFVFLRDGPKGGFVYEELLVVPANTKQQTLQRYSICSVWMLSGSFFCLLFIGEYHPCVYFNSCFREFLQNSIQRGFVSLPAQFVLALWALFWGRFRLSFLVLHRAIQRMPSKSSWNCPGFRALYLSHANHSFLLALNYSFMSGRTASSV